MSRRSLTLLATPILVTAILQANPCPVRADDRHIEVFVTAKDTGDRLAAKPPIGFVPMPQPDEHAAAVMVDASKSFQTVEGIGGALTDAAAETYAKLPPESQREVLTAYFDLPFIKAAIAAAGGRLKLFASPWSPPAWMKTNNDMLQGGQQGGVPGCLGPLLRALRPGVRETGRSDLGAHSPERAHGETDLGVVPVLGGRGARLRARPGPRPDLLRPRSQGC